MRIVLIAVGARQPPWAQAGYREYARRLGGSCRLELVEIPPGRRTSSGSAHKAVAQEAEKMLHAIPRGARVVALDVVGTPWSTSQLAGRMSDWMGGGAPVVLLAGGPDGLSPSAIERADERWSLSPLTLSHWLVRPLVAEALYRAWSVTRGHPYHRA